MSKIVIGESGGATNIEDMEELVILAPKVQTEWIRRILSVSPWNYIITEVDKPDGKHRIMSADLGLVRGNK